MKKVALIVGHTASNQGAVNYLNETEFEFNSYIASYVKFHYPFYSLSVFEKKRDYVKKIKEFNPTLIIELHFNAFESKAYGCTALCLETSQDSKIEAKTMLKKFSKHFKIKNRGIVELKSKNDRGFRNFNGLRDYPMFLFEPCFANFKTKDSEKIIENKEGYTRFLVEHIDNYLLEEKEVSIMNKMIALMQSMIWRK